MTALEVLAEHLAAKALAGTLTLPEGVVEVRFDRRVVREDDQPGDLTARWRSDLEAIELHSRSHVVARLQAAHDPRLVWAYAADRGVCLWLESLGWSQAGDKLWRAPT